MFGSWVQVCYGHLHRLDLLVFGRDGANLVAHLVTFYRHILALNAGEKKRDRLKSYYITATPTQIEPFSFFSLYFPDSSTNAI